MKLYRILLLTLCAYTLISCGGAEERKSVYLEKARISFEAGNLEKARIELKNVVQIDPKDADAYFLLGKIYEQKQDYRKAYSHYLKVDELDHDNLENQAKLGRIYLFLSNEPEKAQEKIDYILAKDPNNPDGLLLKSSQQVKNKNIPEAIKISKSVVDKDPGHVDGAKFLATLYVSSDKNSEAIEVLDNAIKLNQDNEQLNKLLAAVLVKSKNFDRAEILYKNFLERNPDVTASYNNLAEFYNQADNKIKAEDTLRASVENDTGDVDRQLTLARYVKSTKGDGAAITLLKELIQNNGHLGGLRSALAELLYISGDKAAAIQTYNEAIKDFGDEVTAVESHISLAKIYLIDKNFVKAKEIVDAVIKLSPNDPKVNFLNARLALHDKDYEKAIISLRIVTKETPDNIQSFLLLAGIYKLEGNEAQYNTTLNSAYDNNKTNADGLLKLAQFQMSRDIVQAEKIIDDYNAIKDSNYEGLSIKSAILNKNKAHQEAFKISEKLISLYPKKPNGYLQAIPYYSMKNERANAISVLEKGYLTVEDNRKLLLLLTTLQVANEQFDVAEKRVAAEVDAAPNDVTLTILLAKIYMAANKLDSAESLLKSTINNNADNEEAYLLLAQLYQMEKNESSAEATLIKGRENVKSSIKLPLRLATLYEKQNNYQKAIDVYRSAYSSFPGNLIVTNNLASMLSDYGNAKEDLDMAKTLAEKLKESGQPVFMDTIGWVYYKLGDYQLAIKYLSQSVEKAPTANVFNYHLGMAYKMAGDNVNAKKHLEISLSSDKPFNGKDKAKAALKEI